MKGASIRNLIGIALIAPALLLAAVPTCARAAQLEVVASFSILGDFVRQVGGERVRVSVLVGPDQDAHGFQPRPSDARLLRDADLVVANGLGFDPWIERLVQSSGHKRAVVVASAGIEPIEEHAGHGHGHAHGSLDPHAWQDVANARRYVANIAAALGETDPDGAAHYRANALDYDAKLQALDAEIRARLSAIPPSRRTVVSAHDAFGYFSEAYGIRFLAAAGVSNHSEASAAGVARLVRQLRRENVPVVFVENVSDPRQIDRIATEGGARLGGKLFSDALSALDGAAPTYLDMMRHNAETLAEGLLPPER